MKVDKRNPLHWLKLALFAINVMAGIALRAFRRQRPRSQIVLYGHKLSGNLLAIHRRLRRFHRQEFDVTFVTMDSAYHHELSTAGVSSVLATSPALASLLARTEAVISDHGLHAMSPMLRFTSVKFFDVWHGIPFKGFNSDDFRTQHRYDEAWVASPMLKKMYIDRFGFEPENVFATGYARTDRLVKASESVEEARNRLGLEGSDIGKIVLFAPTWKQDSGQRSIYPFGVDEQTFLSTLSAMATRARATVVVRAHLNSTDGGGKAWPRIVNRSFAQFPDTEELLLVSDILVCDWSSIAFDFLLLARPAVFLDVEPPFAKGFSLDASYRYGAIATGFEQTVGLLEAYLDRPDSYRREFGLSADGIRRAIYGEMADGEATTRCVERLQFHLGARSGPSHSET